MSNEQIREIAAAAHDALMTGDEPAFDLLDAQAQAMLFDTAAAIVNHGGPTTPYEVKVAELAAVPPPPEAFAAKAGGGDEKLRKDEEMLQKDQEKLRAAREKEEDRVAVWKGAVTKDEKERREDEEERFDKEDERLEKEAERIEKARAEQLPAHTKAAPKNGPDKK
jgi:Skp family chaperone for outer membrane proteins